MANESTELASAARMYWAADGHKPGGGLRIVDYKAASKGLHPSLKGIKIVDCDTHITEAPDLYTSRAPARLKDKVPKVRRVDGIDRWFVGDRDFGTLGGYDESVRRKVLQTNAAKLYNLPF